jgi:hypothetical protein
MVKNLYSYVKVILIMKDMIRTVFVTDVSILVKVNDLFVTAIFKYFPPCVYTLKLANPLKSKVEK